MVVLTIVTQNNGETIFFDQPIPEVHLMKLISCSLYNSWDTLKTESIAMLRGTNGKLEKVSKFPPGHYNLENLRANVTKNEVKFEFRGRSRKIHFSLFSSINSP